MTIRPRSAATSAHVVRASQAALVETLEERIALTINYTIAPNTTLDIFPISAIIPAAPAGMDRMEVNLATIPGVAHGTIYRVSGLTAYPWGSGAPNYFTVGSPNNRIYGGEGFRYVNNGTGNGTTESIPVKFRDGTGFNFVNDTIAIKIDANLKPPTIATQPGPFIQIPPNATASMTVVASGDPPITYQWYKGIAPDASQPIAGATSATYTTPSLSVVQQYYYWVRVTNSGGHADSQTVTVQVATPTSVVTSNATTTFSTSTHTINLSATVSPAVNSGKVTFTSLPLGGATADSPTVTNGLSGNAAFPIPAGAAVGTYSFEAHYVGPAGLADSYDTSKTITITKANTTTTASNKTLATSGNGQNVTLGAAVTSPAGAVNEGTVTFTVKDGATTIGSPVTSNTVSNGGASAVYALPLNSRAGVYTIQAVYNPGPDYNGSSDSTHSLTASPVVSTNAATIPINATTFVINGFGFDSTTLANNVVGLPVGVTGTLTNATPTQLTMSGVSGLALGPLTIALTVRTIPNGPPTSVGTVVPVVTTSANNLAASATTMTFNGFGFSTTPANNTVTFNNGATGTVTAATKTQLTVSSLAGLKGGVLNASVTTSGFSSGAGVQVATVIPIVTSSAAALLANATTLTINGVGFSTTAANNTVTFSGGATGTVTAATATQLTVSNVTGLIAGALSAVVTVNGASSGAPVQVATVSPVVTSSTALLAANAASITIKGFGFASSNAANSVVFTPAAAGSVTASSPTQLTYTFTALPLTAGMLRAVVTSNGQGSGASVQVATVDVTPPVAANGKLNLNSPNFGTITVDLSEDVDPALLKTHLTVTAVGGPALSYAPTAVVQDAVTHVATFSFATLFADRNYHVTLSAAGLTDLAGNPMAADYAFDTFFLNGDFSRDRIVDFNDLVLLAQHYNTNTTLWKDGDGNGDGKVDFNDLVKLAQNYNLSLPIPAPPVPASAAPASPAPHSAATTVKQPVRPRPVFSVTPVSKPRLRRV